MRGAWSIVIVVAVAVALGGCTKILGLDSVDSIDRDNDNVPDATDNCPDDSNPDQSDFDGNGKGDVCDLCTDGGAEDVDGDGIPDGCDGCIGNGADVDQDHIDDGCDPCIGNGMDADQDGIDDACDACIGNGMDVDHDSIDDACDTCVQKFVDTDNDMIDDGCDPCIAQPHIDDDGDGIENACDPCPIGPQHDEDGDTIYDACDTCKVVRDTFQFDSDDDQVGNRCDPSMTEIDYERMDPFTVLDPSWFSTGSPWTIVNDTVRLSSQFPSYRWLSPLRSIATIQTRVRFDPSPTFQGSPFVSLIAFDSTSPTAVRQLYCSVAASGNLVAHMTVNGAPGSSTTSLDTISSGTYFNLTMTIDDTSKGLICTAEDGNKTATAGISIGVGDLGVMWFPGLSVEFGEGTFQYFDQIGGLP